MKNHKLLPILFSAFFLTGCKSVPTEQNLLYGVIYDGNSSPINDVNIYVNDKIKDSSDVYGHFTIEKAFLGKTYDLYAQKEGYETIRISIPFSNSSQFVYLKMYSTAQLLNLAEKKVSYKEYDEAYKYLSRAESTDTNHTSIKYLKALIEYNRMNYEESLAILNELINMNIHNTYIYLLCANNYQYGIKDFDKAKAMLKMCLTISFDPEIETRYNSL